MVSRFLPIYIALVCLSAGHIYRAPVSSDELAQVINNYRAEQGLSRIAVSPLLNRVAEFHVQDLENNNPARNGCNLHSWSKSKRWTPCCYRDGNFKESCMWNKPREITDGRYNGNGYEIAAWSSHSMTPEYALSLWQKSEGHHNIILNRGTWGMATWRSMGVAISEHYAVVWFGEI